MSFNKTYFEIYAALVLCDIGYISAPFDVDWIREKPDIQYKDKGIEVTRAITSDQGLQYNYFNKVSGKSLEEKKYILNNIDPRQQSKLWESEYLNVSEIPDNHCGNLLKSINDKNKKIINYKNFKQQSLFIFSTLVQEAGEITEILSDDLQTINNRFDVIFVLNFDELIIFSNAKEMKHQFSSDKLTYFKEEAKSINRQYFDGFGIRKTI